MCASMPSAHIGNDRDNVHNEDKVLDAVHTNPYYPFISQVSHATGLPQRVQFGIYCKGRVVCFSYVTHTSIRVAVRGQ